jgi:hypothetical protein
MYINIKILALCGVAAQLLLSGHRPGMVIFFFLELKSGKETLRQKTASCSPHTRRADSGRVYKIGQQVDILGILRVDRRSSSVFANDSAGSRSSVLLGEAAALGNTAVLGEVKVELAVIPLARESNKGKGEEWNQQDIEDAKEDEHANNANFVTTIGQAPGDRVEEPEKVEPTSEEEVVPANTHTLGTLEALGESVYGQEQVSGSPEGEEAPLVVGCGVGADKVSYDPREERSVLVLLVSQRLTKAVGSRIMTYQVQDRKTLKKMEAQAMPLRRPRETMATGKPTTQLMYFAKKI